MRATVERSGKWWVAVPECGGVTQAEHPSLLMTGEKISAGDVVLEEK